MPESKEKRKFIKKLKTKYKSFNEQKNAIILLILCEMKNENGATEALASDPRVSKFNSDWSLKYIRLFRAFSKSRNNQ